MATTLWLPLGTVGVALVIKLNQDAVGTQPEGHPLSARVNVTRSSTISWNSRPAIDGRRLKVAVR